MSDLEAAHSAQPSTTTVTEKQRLALLDDIARETVRYIPIGKIAEIWAQNDFDTERAINEQWTKKFSSEDIVTFHGGKDALRQLAFDVLVAARVLYPSYLTGEGERALKDRRVTKWIKIYIDECLDSIECWKEMHEEDELSCAWNAFMNYGGPRPTKLMKDLEKQQVRSRAAREKRRLARHAQ